MFAKDVYVSRRARLMQSMGDAFILLLGNNEAPCNYPDNAYKFRQDSSFLYFFGHSHPGMAAILDASTGEEVLFADDVDIDDIIWMGPQESIAHKAEAVGVAHSERFAKLKDYVAGAVAKGRKVHFLPPYRNYNKILLNELLGLPIASLKENSSVKLINAVVDLRIKKEACEIEQIDIACNIGYAMHFAAMKMARLGMVEQELAGIMEGIAHQQGSMVSFATILSQNGETLHNHSHHQILTEGRMFVVDAGAENNMNYCSDLTRTLPCSGKFTQQQKEIYNIVAAANNCAASLARPSVTYKEVHLEASKVLAKGLIDLGLMKGDVQEAVAAGAHALFMPHGLGHNMGHDMEDLGQIYVGYDSVTRPSTQFGLASLRMGRELKEGYVVTNEPGCYFIPALIEKWKAEGINKEFINFDKLKAYYKFGGIRLEDDLLITSDGCRLLGSKRLPITPEEVEEQMGC